MRAPIAWLAPESTRQKNPSVLTGGGTHADRAMRMPQSRLRRLQRDERPRSREIVKILRDQYQERPFFYAELGRRFPQRVSVDVHGLLRFSADRDLRRREIMRVRQPRMLAAE